PMEASPRTRGIAVHRRTRTPADRILRPTRTEAAHPATPPRRRTMIAIIWSSPPPVRGSLIRHGRNSAPFRLRSPVSLGKVRGAHRGCLLSIVADFRCGARGRAVIRDLPVFDDELDLGSVGDIAVLDRSSYDVFLLIGDDGDLLSVAVEEFAV